MALIPDDVRPRFYDNLISGMAMHLAGPCALRLLFQAFVVVVGFLILAGAVNTAIVGSNAVLNRVSEDGVLTEWFRQPHARYGTTLPDHQHDRRACSCTIMLSRGDVYVLGEAYAFGVVWSFAFKALAVLVLRFKEPGPREWRVPLNLRVGGIELPDRPRPRSRWRCSPSRSSTCSPSRWRRSRASRSRVVLYALFVVSERAERAARSVAARARGSTSSSCCRAGDVGLEQVAARPGNILVPVRDYNTLAHLDWALDARRHRAARRRRR